MIGSSAPMARGLINLRPLGVITPFEFGAKGNSDGKTSGSGANDTLALQNALDYCFVNKKVLNLGDAKYRITSALNVRSPIVGVSPLSSVIFNDGTGDALIINDVDYYAVFSNFLVQGNSNSRDGIVYISVLDGSTENSAYMNFYNVRSEYHGRHGLNHRCGWCVKYIGCKFQYNGGLGAYFQSHPDLPINNDILSIGTDYRWNGGQEYISGAIDDNHILKGGLRIDHAHGFHIMGGVIESNNPWGIIIVGMTRDIYALTVEKIYTELNGVFPEYSGDRDADYGGVFYIQGSNIKNMAVRDCIFQYGPTNDSSTKNNYLWYIDSTVPYDRIYQENNVDKARNSKRIQHSRPYFRNLNGSWSGMVEIQSEKWRDIGKAYVSNFIVFEQIAPTQEGITITKVKDMWSIDEISTSTSEPTTVATTNNEKNIQVFRDDSNDMVYVKYNSPGNNYPTYFKVSFC